MIRPLMFATATSLVACGFPPLPPLDHDASAPGDAVSLDSAAANLDALSLDAGPPCTRRIAFTDVTANGATEVYVANVDGTGIVNLSLHDSDDSNPHWSPVSNLIAFDSFRAGERDVFAIGADGSTLRNITQNAADDYLPEWSPDGAKIAFLRRTTGSPRLWVIDATGFNPRELANISVFYPFRWAPSGDRLVVESSDGDLYVVSLAGGPATNITTWTTDRARDATWSADGSRIAFTASSDNGRSEIFTVAADGTNSMNVSADPGANDNSPTWLPDGTLAFSSDRDGASFKIYRTLSAQPITSNTAVLIDGDIQPLASPDGAKIAFTRRIGVRLKLGIVDSDGRNPVELSTTTPTPTTTNPAWSPCQ